MSSCSFTSANLSRKRFILSTERMLSFMRMLGRVSINFIIFLGCRIVSMMSSSTTMLKNSALDGLNLLLEKREADVNWSKKYKMRVTSLILKIASYEASLHCFIRVSKYDFVIL